MELTRKEHDDHVLSDGRATFVLSADARSLIELMSAAKIGETITYEKMDTHIGRDVRKHCPGALVTAKNAMRRDYGMVFKAINNIGYKRLDGEGIIGLAYGAREKVKRISDNSLRNLDCVAYQNLGRDQQTKYNTAVSTLGVLSAMSSAKAMERIGNHIGNDSDDGKKTLGAQKAALIALGQEV